MCRPCVQTAGAAWWLPRPPAKPPGSASGRNWAAKYESILTSKPCWAPAIWTACWWLCPKQCTSRPCWLRSFRGFPFFTSPRCPTGETGFLPVLEELLKAPQVHQADLELRFLPVVAAAAERLAQGAIGEPQTARIRMNGTWSARPGADLSLPHLLAPWYVDALDAILGSHPRRVLVQDGRGTEGRMQAYALTQLDYGGVWGTFQANISSVHGPETWVEVQGRDGDLFADLFTGELRIRSRSCPEWRVDRVVCALRPFAGWPGLRECLADFLDRLEGKPAPGVPAEDMARLHCLGLAAEESIDSLAWASVRSMDELRQNLR